MKECTARTLTVGSRVCWDHNASDGGTVVETGYCQVKVKWDDKSQGISIHFFTEMSNMGLLPRNDTKPEDVTNLSLGEVGI